MVKGRHNKTIKDDKQEKQANKGKKKPKRDGKPRQEEHLQQIPYRLREILKSKEKMNVGSKKLKKAMRAASSKAQTEKRDQEDIPVPQFRRGKLESELAYLRRMTQETQHVLFLTQNQVEKQPELEVEEKDGQSNKQKSEKKKLSDKGRLQRLHLKKAQKSADRAEKEMFVDEVQFGEVAMAPPSLTAKPKKAPVKSQSRKDLLLSSLYGNDTVSTAKPSIAKQRILEEERERVVQAYRQLKKRKQEESEQHKSRISKLQNPQ